jgi:superfamily II DNA or RNA helicase/predicted RNA-binding Zn-ribbon protein involved in translation (DUF1610 family)
MYVLRPQQIEFEIAIRDAFRTNRCVLATAPTGFGKGVVIADMGFKSAAKGKRVLIATNRRQIVKQLTEHCENVGLHVGVIMGDHEPDLEAPVQVASIQTLKRRQFDGVPDPGFIILDECVAGDSIVDTEFGMVTIYNASRCKWVRSMGPSGIRYQRILRWLPRGKKKTCLLTFASGRTIRVTENHKFATAEGWVEARCLTQHHKIVCVNVDAEGQSLQGSDSAKVTGESSILSEGTRSEKNDNSKRHCVSADVANKSVFEDSQDTANTFTATRRVSNAANTTRSRLRNCSGVRFSARSSETVQSEFLTAEAQRLGCMARTARVNGTGCDTSAESLTHLERHGTYAIPLGMESDHADGELALCIACRRYTPLSHLTGRKLYHVGGSIRLGTSDLLGGFATTAAVVKLEISQFTQKAIQPKSIPSSSSGSGTITARLHCKGQEEDTFSVGFQERHRMPSSQPSENTFQNVCSTSFDTLLSIADDAEIDVFDLDVENDHCFFANGLLVHNCHQEHDAYAKLLKDRFPTIPALGLTATPVGPGGSRIDHFDIVVEPIRNTQVIDAGHLLRVHPYLAPSEPDLGGINLKAVSKDELGQRVESCTIYGDVFKIWEPYSHMQTMVVLPSRAVCNQFHKIAVARGITAQIVDGTTAQSDRNSTFSDFKATDCQMLLGVDVVREGLDLPIAQCLIDLQPTHQFRVYWQKLGRVKRPHTGQESAVVIDLAGNLWRHWVHPDQDPPWEELTKDNTIEEVIEKKAGIRCPECGSKDYFGPNGGLYKCEDCGHTWAKKNPWVCPHCKQRLAPHQKVIGGICPNCSQKVGTKQTRQIRMADGSIRSVPADEIKRRKKSKADGEEAAWLKWVFIANGWNSKPANRSKPPKTLTWCKAMFQREQGHWPREGLRYMPARESADWKRAPASVFPHLRK